MVLEFRINLNLSEINSECLVWLAWVLMNSWKSQLGTNPTSSELSRRSCSKRTHWPYTVDLSNSSRSNDPKRVLQYQNHHCNRRTICDCLCTWNGSLGLSQSSHSDVLILIENHFALSQTQRNQILSFWVSKSSSLCWSLFFRVKEKYSWADCHEKSAIRLTASSEIKIALEVILIESIL